MVSIEIPIKDSTFLLCGICKENKGRSRKFHTEHALKYHLTYYHRGELKQ